MSIGKELDQLKTLAKVTDGYVLCSRMVTPSGKVHEYLRIVDRSVFDPQKNPADLCGLARFYMDDEWYSHMTAICELPEFPSPEFESLQEPLAG
jgi:hypothetical protein